MTITYPQPDLADGTVRLRPWRESDLDCIRAAATDPSIPQGTTVPVVFTPEAGLAFVHRQWGRRDGGEGISLAMADPVGDEAHGLLVLLHQPQPRVLNIGYWVVPAARHRGLAGAAVQLATDWALAATGTVRVQARVHPGNTASLRTLERAGYSVDGRLPGFFGDAPAVVLSRA